MEEGWSRLAGADLPHAAVFGLGSSVRGPQGTPTGRRGRRLGSVGETDQFSASLGRLAREGAYTLRNRGHRSRPA